MAVKDRPRASVTGQQILQSAFKSGALNPKLTIEEAARLGGGIEEIAGYVLAWERYVLVVAKELDEEIVFRRG